MRGSFEIRQENFSLQAHFVKPAFDLLKDVPHLAKHLLEALDRYGIRLADFHVDSRGENLGEVNLQIALQHRATARIHLDRIDLTSTYPPFFHDDQGGSFTADLFDSVQDYSPGLAYGAFAVTREVHGRLDFPLKDFLDRFSAPPPKSMGPALGSGSVYYFGPGENRLTGSLIFDFSRVVEDGLFLKMTILFDATQMETRDLMTVFRARFSSLVDELGLEMTGRIA